VRRHFRGRKLGISHLEEVAKCLAEADMTVAKLDLGFRVEREFREEPELGPHLGQAFAEM
jgi:hypothetical protein